MFGYVMANSEELKIKEYKTYRSYYCGLCAALKKRHGLKGQLTLNYDMVFLALLLTGLYEPETQFFMKRCPVHPFEKHQTGANEMLDYVADMNILLAYHSLEDGWQDDHNILKKTAATLLKRRYRKVAAKYPKKAEAVVSYINNLSACQKKNVNNIDEVAGLTGEMMSELFCYKQDEWEMSLRKIGFYLGKFVYLLDAYDDLDDDIKKKQYNIWLSYMEEENFDNRVEAILDMMMAECCREFEMLPILQDVNILRNILYAGVFNKYALRRQQREQKNEKLIEKQKEDK